MLTLLALYCLLGAVAGVLAGLLGIGGGLVIVPMLTLAFEWQGVSQAVIMHMALGTSLASIMFTSVSSFMAHHRRGAVRWDIVKSIAPGIVAGTYLGGVLAHHMSTAALKAVFVLFLYYVASQMLRGKKPKPHRQTPGPAGMTGVGGVIGVFSALVGIGGGTLSVPFMIFCNVAAHTAIGTSAAIGLPIALAGTASYLVNGLAAPGLPPFSLGYVSLPALAGIAAVSILTAPLGVRLAHNLPVDRLKRVFALLLILVATRMLWTLV